MSKSTLLRDYEHLVSDLGNYFDVTGDAYGPVVEHLARLERRAKDWAKGQVDVDTIVHPGTEFCRSCDRGGTSERASVLHSADCDAANILDLERESVG